MVGLSCMAVFFYMKDFVFDGIASEQGMTANDAEATLKGFYLIQMEF